MSRSCSIPSAIPIWMEYDIGCDADGKLTYCKVEFVGDTGAHASVGMKVLERSAGHATGAYNFPVTDVKATAVYTNNLPCGAMRGFGVNQAAFGLESLIDELCEQGGFDRWQFRYDNALVNGDMTATGQIIEAGAGAKETLLAVKDEFYGAKYAGLACGIKNTGVGNGMPDVSSAKITIVSADKVHHRSRLDGDGPGRQHDCDAGRFARKRASIRPSLKSSSTHRRSKKPA